MIRFLCAIQLLLTLSACSGPLHVDRVRRIQQQFGIPWATTMRRAEQIAKVSFEGLSYEVPYTRPRPRNNSATPLLCIHGTPGGLDVWAPCVYGRDGKRGLVSDFDVIAIDLPGHGLSGYVIPNASFERLADFVAAFLHNVGVKSTIVMGHSYGGEIAWRLAARHPKLVSKLVLINASGFPRLGGELSRSDKEAIHWQGEYILEQPESAYAWVSKGMVSADLRQAYHKFSQFSGRPHYVDMLYYLYVKAWPNLQTMTRLTREEARRDDELETIEELQRIQLDVLLIWGQKDEWYTVGSQAARFKVVLPRARLAVLNDARHNLHEEWPERVNTLIRMWTGLDRARRAPNWLNAHLSDPWFCD